MSSEKKRILIDCDGPLSDFVGKFIESAKEIYEITIERDQITSFNIEDCTPITKDQFMYICRQEGFCSSISPIDGSIEAVNKLRDCGFDIYCVTAPMISKHWFIERICWLKNNFGIDFHHQIHTCAKHVVDGDFFIDDNIGNVESWMKEHKDKNAFVWHSSYNSSYEQYKTIDDSSLLLSGSVFRSNNWDEIIKMIC